MVAPLQNTVDRSPGLPVIPASDRRSVNLLLVLGALLLIGSLVAFGSIAEDVVPPQSPTQTTTEEIVQFDYTVSNNIHATTDPYLVRAMLVVSLFGSEMLILATFVLAGYLAWRHRWRDLRLLVIAMAGEELFNLLFKLSFHRARPAFADPLLTATGYSFPSGHSMASMVFYGLCAYFLLRQAIHWRDRILIVVAFIAIVIVIGYSRIYLGLHYPSDVLGGYLAGLGWLSFTISGMRLFEDWQTRRSRGTHGAYP